MDLGIFNLVRSLTTNSIAVVDKLGSASVIGATALETTLKAVNVGADIAHTSAQAVKNELDKEFAETLALMDIETQKRLEAAKSSKPE